MLNKKAAALSLGIIWGFAMLVLAAINLKYPSYGSEFLSGLAGVYPGFVPGVASSLVIGPIYGFIDALIGGYILVSLYNFIDKKTK